MADIGIVMPVYYQNPDHLRTAIQTVLDQTYRNFELIIVVDGAQEMVPLIQAYVHGDARVHILFYEQNHGVAHALNIGFARLLTNPDIEYVTWVSSDNVHYPYMLESMHREITRCPPEVGIVYSSFNRILPDGSPAHPPSFLNELHHWQNQPKERLLSHCTIGPAFLHRVSFCKMVGDYRFTLVQDYDYWLRMTDYCEIRYIPDQLMAYRVESKYSLTTQAKETKEKEEFLWKEMRMAQTEAKRRRKKGSSPFVDASNVWGKTHVVEVTSAKPSSSVAPTLQKERVDVTILYFIEDLAKPTVEVFLQLYPALTAFSRVWLLSASPYGDAGRLADAVKKRFGMTLHVMDTPYASMYTAVKAVIENITTTYTAILRTPGAGIDWSWIKEAVSKHEQDRSRIYAVFRRGNMLRTQTAPGRLVHAEYVYRTEALQRLIFEGRA